MRMGMGASVAGSPCSVAARRYPARMKVLMFYELAADGLAKAPAHFASHQARLREFHGRGVLLMRTFMDEVIYNRSGNEVTLIKRRK